MAGAIFDYYDRAANPAYSYNSFLDEYLSWSAGQREGVAVKQIKI
jgi:hypothetical protein